MPIRNKLFTLALALFVILWACRALAAYAPGELLVRFRPETSFAAASQRHRDLGVRVAGSLPALGVERLRLPPGLSVAEAVRHYRGLPEVELAQPNYIYHVAREPNDPRYPDQWHLPKIDAPAAWDTVQGSTGIVVAVVDTGVDYTHPDISGNMWPDLGWDFVTPDNDPDDDYAPTYHGTHVAGTIGAVGNNGLGVSGVCWRVRIMALKALDSNGDGYETDVADAVEWALSHGADIVNLSIEREADEIDGGLTVLELAIARARRAGVLVVTAAGNFAKNLDASETKSYPGCFEEDNILNVASTTSGDSLTWSSNYGPSSVDLTAPGQSIFSLNAWDADKYRSLSGTSMAAAVASGAAALLLAAHPDLSYEQLRGYLIRYCEDFNLPVLSEGRLDLAESLAAADAGLPWQVASDNDPDNDGDSRGCFIATAAYGSPLAGEVHLLSEFRDRWLATNHLGLSVAAAYYRLGPPAARYISERPWLPPLVRATIRPTLPLARLSLASPLLGCLVILTAAGSVGLLARRQQPKRG